MIKYSWKFDSQNNPYISLDTIDSAVMDFYASNDLDFSVPVKVTLSPTRYRDLINGCCHNQVTMLEGNKIYVLHVAISVGVVPIRPSQRVSDDYIIVEPVVDVDGEFEKHVLE